MLDSKKVKLANGVGSPLIEVGGDSGPPENKRSRGHNHEEGSCKKKKKGHKWPKTCLQGHRKSKCKNKRRVSRAKPEAPFNSTQFIMGEHDYLNDSDLSSRPRRHRDSSFSLESEDIEDEVSSTEEEEEFITQQFWSAYEEFNAERLESMSKSQLVQEYFALEEKLTQLEKELKEAREQDRRRIREPSPIDEEDEEELVPGEVPVDAETAAKIEIFRNEIQNLEIENDQLRQENTALRKHTCRRTSSSSSSDSSSSSTDSESEELVSPPSSITVPSKSPRHLTEEDKLPPKKVSRNHDFDSGIASSEGVSCGSSSEDKADDEFRSRESRVNVP